MLNRIILLIVLGSSAISGLGQQPKADFSPITQETPTASPQVAVEIKDLSRKFLDFYRAAVSEGADEDRRWQLWKEKYDFAAVPPIPAGQKMARERLDAAWSRYVEIIPRVELGPSVLKPTPQSRLQQVAALLGSTKPVHVRLVVFVGTFGKNAFAMGLRDGVNTIAIPLEDSDQEHAITMTHEFTHAVQMQMGEFHQQDVASAIFAEGLAMRVAEKLNPGLDPTVYTDSSPKWLDQCTSQLPAVLAGIRSHLTDTGAEAVSRFTMGTGITGMDREVYCAGWFVVGRMLGSGSTFEELAHLSQADARARVTAELSRFEKDGLRQ
jgi:hypothetical protein